MNYEFPEVMVDVETTGTDPSHSHMIQLSAVRFNLKEGTIDPNVFDRCLHMAPGRFWDEGTRTFWAQFPDVLSDISARMEFPERVMQGFARWAGKGLRMWAKPISFDYSFVASYCRQFNIDMPFAFTGPTGAMDQNTFIRARHFPDVPPKYEDQLEFVGDKHNGLDDVFHQIKVVMTAYEATK